MQEFKYTINGQKYEVAVGDASGNNVEVTVNGETYTVEREPKAKPVKERVIVKAPVKTAAPAAATPATPGAAPVGETLKAPLPGTIRDILVNVGDVVEEGQHIVVLEAMKMANNLDAEKAGKVSAILVNVGDAVMENTPLVAFE